MKKIIAILVLSTLVSFRTNEVKKLKAELTKDQWEYHFNHLSNIRAYIDKTSLPHNDVKFIQAAIDSMMSDIVPQLKLQIDTTTKK